MKFNVIGFLVCVGIIVLLLWLKSKLQPEVDDATKTALQYGKMGCLMLAWKKLGWLIIIPLLFYGTYGVLLGGREWAEGSALPIVVRISNLQSWPKLSEEICKIWKFFGMECEKGLPVIVDSGSPKRRDGAVKPPDSGNKPPDSPPGDVAIVKPTGDQGLALRESAGTESSQLTQGGKPVFMPPGSEVKLLRANNGEWMVKKIGGAIWYQVIYNGTTGWCHGRWLSVPPPKPSSSGR